MHVKSSPVAINETAKELFDNISAILDNYEEGGEHEAYIELRRILVLVNL